MTGYEEALEKLKKYDQEQVFAYYDSLEEAEKKALVEQVNSADFSVLSMLKEQKEVKRGVISPLTETVTLDKIKENEKSYLEAGIKALKEGKVGCVLLAGGMGTRLGSDDPKGMYNIGKTHPLYIFEMQIRNLMDVVNLCGRPIDLFIMTSNKNDEKTRTFFQEHNYFGYDPNYVHFFIQEMAIACDYNGKIFLEDKDSMSMSPNGNGGWFVSLKNAGLLDYVKDKGIQWLNVYAVDNVLQKMADPLFVGATELSGFPVGSKVVAKAAPDEKVGVLCKEDGRPSIVEYYEMTQEMMNAKDENGNYAYNFGVILNYLFRVKELEEIVGRDLPLHIVEKKIGHLDADGQFTKPKEPNGYKFENLVLDMIHMLSDCLAYEVVRDHEFAPIKNKTGVDSVESAQALLEKNGIEL